MTRERPNPDNLLERVRTEQSNRGRLKIYLGMAAGAGKTYTMLTDAIVEKRRGIDVVVGYLEPHGREETERLVLELEQLPHLLTKHKDIEINEFDLDAALKRKPALLLVDELAHTNAAGSRHAKRWQDIYECLNNGISVATTINVQHIESLTDIVTKITGITVHETVPDAVVRQADEIELIDITPEELIQRLKDGKVYVSEKVDTALANFFKPGNLLALRELVLRLTAERVDDQLSTFRRLHEVREIWPVKPRVLVCVSPHYLSERVVRTAWRLASSIHTELIALSVENPSRRPGYRDSERFAQDGLELADKLGATIMRTVAHDVVAEILRVAREKNANIIVMGKPVRSRLRDYFFGSIADELIRLSGDLDVYVITDKVGSSNVPLMPRTAPPSVKSVLSAVIISTIATLVCAVADPYLELSNLVMFYLLGVAWAGSKLGRLESIVTSILSVLAFDFFFVPPRWTFAVADMQYVVTFVVMLVIAMLISTLTQQLKRQSELVNRKERRTASLYDVSKRLASAVSIPQIALIVREKSLDLFGCRGMIFVPNPEGQLECGAPGTNGPEYDQNELAVVKWVATHKSPAGMGTDTLAGAKGQYLPLTISGSLPAVLGIYYVGDKFQPFNDPLVEAFATQVGSAVERVMAEQESTTVQVEIERERVKNLLLSSISHDFRTPLAAISGAADTLLDRFHQEDSRAKELLHSVKDEAGRLSRLVRNVLDLTRLEAGEIQLKIEWQSVEELIGTALERTSPLIGKRRIEVNIPSNLPLIKADPIMMEQVFINLLENFAKHTAYESRMTISASANGNQMLIEFSDNGSGLPKEKTSRVFEKAFRGAQSKEGFGLGLTICQTIMRAHNGTITAANNPGGGACFTLAMPLPDNQPEIKNV